MKTSDLIGPALDWAVATALGQAPVIWENKVYLELDGIVNRHLPSLFGYTRCAYTEQWAQGGPIIERENIGFKYAGRDGNGPLYVAWKSFGLGPHKCESSRYGPTPLIAAMRCFVASKLGDEIEIPDELI